MYYKVFRSISLLLDVLQSTTLKFYYMNFFSQTISSPYKVPWRCVHTEARETSTTTTEIKCHSKAMKHPRQSPEQPLRCKNTNESMLIQCDSNKHETSHGKDSENDGDRMWNSNFLKEIFSKPLFLVSFSLDVNECALYNLGKRWWMGRHTLNSQNPLARNWVSRLIFLQKTTWPTTHIKYLVRNSQQRSISRNTTRIPHDTYHIGHLLPFIGIHITIYFAWKSLMTCQPLTPYQHPLSHGTVFAVKAR